MGIRRRAVRCFQLVWDTKQRLLLGYTRVCYSPHNQEDYRCSCIQTDRRPKGSHGVMLCVVTGDVDVLLYFILLHLSLVEIPI